MKSAEKSHLNGRIYPQHFINAWKMIPLLVLAFIFCLGINDAYTVEGREDILKDFFSEGITVDLRDPVYSDGVLTTENGGVISGPNLRIQAKKIKYARKMVDGKPVFTIEAEDQLMLEYGCYIFIGDRLEYDFQAKEGVIYNSRSAIEPWYFGGEKIDLLPDNSVAVHNGYITTSDHLNPDWEITTNYAHLSEDHLVDATNVKFRFLKLPLFWIPRFKANLDWILDSPIRYRIRWGGVQGLRVGMIYEILSWRNLKTYLRFDYRFNLGPGGGIETEYESPDGNETCYTINYIARDSSTEEPNERTRYRFEGVYTNCIDEGRLMIDLSYDKLSDKEMATDYYDKNLDLKTAGRTQLNIRREYDEISIVNFFTRARINDFQTVKQELPVITANFHPVTLGSTGIISENIAKIGYLDFKYSDDTFINVKDYHSTRFEYRETLYRPFNAGPIVITPQAKALAIFYGSSPQMDSKCLGVISLGGEAKTQLYKCYGNFKHIAEPYIRYQYIPAPTISPNSHFIFDIQDGWHSLHTLRFGARNLLYLNCPLIRNMTTDVYSYAFFNTPTQRLSIPRMYGKLLWDVTPRIRQSIGTAWDFERQGIGYINLRSDITLTEDLAFSTEYRHRNAFAWRKVDPDNFIMESFRTERELHDSIVSDRRDTFLFHIFYRFLPNWSCEFQLRRGWNRRIEPNYREYQVDLMTSLRSGWDLRLSYQQKEDDHRVALYISLGAARPDCFCDYTQGSSNLGFRQRAIGRD